MLLLSSLAIVFCSQEKKKDCEIVAVCQKIIIQDSIDDITINFLVSYKNIGKENIKIFANSFSNKIKDKTYKNKGLFLIINQSNTPIGQFYPLNNFELKSGKEIKILYTYNNKFPNKKNIMDKKKSFLNQLKEVELHYYSGYKDQMQKSREEINPNYKYKNIYSSFPIDMSNLIIEYKKEINIEEAIELVDGRI